MEISNNSVRKKALITGIAGQDGSFLAEFLFDKGYNVFGVDKFISQIPLKTRNCIIQLYDIDLAKPNKLRKLIQNIHPDEIYHLAAYHFSSQKDGNNKMSFEPFNSINLLATNEILETIKEDLPKCRFFYASSSHIFGKVDSYPQNENTSYKPESLYAITKAAGNSLCKFYRDYYNIYASVGILYNHESTRRSLSFITSQIAEAAAKAYLGFPIKLIIRDLDGIVDWGAAKDYVNAMWLTLQQNQSDDYLISSGISYKVSDFVRIAFQHVGLNPEDFVFQDQDNIKKETIPLIGDSTKIKKTCGWVPVISFKELVEEMVDLQIDNLNNYK